jgi:hypothetical protein
MEKLAGRNNFAAFQGAGRGGTIIGKRAFSGKESSFSKRFQAGLKKIHSCGEGFGRG